MSYSPLSRLHDTTGYQTSWTTGCSKRGRRLHDTTGCKIKPVVQPIWQLVVSCKRGLRSGTGCMARVNDGSHSFTCHPHVYPQVEWTMPAFNRWHWCIQGMKRWHVPCKLMKNRKTENSWQIRIQRSCDTWILERGLPLLENSRHATDRCALRRVHSRDRTELNSLV